MIDQGPLQHQWSARYLLHHHPHLNILEPGHDPFKARQINCTQIRREDVRSNERFRRPQTMMYVTHI